MVVGKAIGKLARERYPSGIFVPFPQDDSTTADQLTAECIMAGHKCLFESTFVANGCIARLDVISKNDTGGWTVDEAKSSSVKPPKVIAKDKVLDLAFQFHVARKAGLEVANARLILVDTKYVWDGSPFSGHSLLGAVDLTALCNEQSTYIAEHSESLNQTLSIDSEPDVETNTHCKECDYFDHCHKSGPKHDLITLPRIRAQDVTELREKGYNSIDQILDEEVLTTVPRKRMRNVIVSGKPYIGEGLGAALGAIPFPAVFLDFESSNPALPMYEGTRPYQQICFQWSAHVLDSPDGVARHLDYLADNLADPRVEFCRTLWEAVKECSAIVHYSPFEVTRVKEMAEEDIPLARELQEAFRTKAVDLEKVVSEHVYLEEFRGQTSIKVVLPALVPTMSYKELVIGDGTEASLGFRKMLSASTPLEEAEALRAALLTYCCQDTMAMVEIFRALRDLSSRDLIPR